MTPTDTQARENARTWGAVFLMAAAQLLFMGTQFDLPSNIGYGTMLVIGGLVYVGVRCLTGPALKGADQ